MFWEVNLLICKLVCINQHRNIGCYIFSDYYLMWRHIYTLLVLQCPHQDFSFLMVYWFSLDSSHFSHIYAQHRTRSCAWPSHETTSSCWSWENFILVSVKNRVHLAQGEWALLAGWLATIHSWSQPCLWDYATRGNWMWLNALLL